MTEVLRFERGSIGSLLWAVAGASPGWVVVATEAQGSVSDELWAAVIPEGRVLRLRAPGRVAPHSAFWREGQQAIWFHVTSPGEAEGNSWWQEVRLPEFELGARRSQPGLRTPVLSEHGAYLYLSVEEEEGGECALRLRRFDGEKAVLRIDTRTFPASFFDLTRPALWLAGRYLVLWVQACSPFHWPELWAVDADTQRWRRLATDGYLSAVPLGSAAASKLLRNF